MTTSFSSDRLDRLNLLLHHDEQRRVQPVTNLAQWQRRRDAILAAMQDIMGPLPANAPADPPAMRVIEEVDRGDHLQQLITYEADPGCPTPAYLLTPHDVRQGRRQATAILCLHPTHAKLGHKTVIDGLGDKPNRQYATDLARRGHVILAPAYPHLADYEPDLAALGYASGTMKAIHDNRRGLDLLQSLPGVRAEGFGAIGHSLGGHNAVYTAVFDPRIKAVVSSCGLGLYTDYMDADPAAWQPGKGWTQDRYMPRLAAYAGRLADIPFDFAEMIAALAPRRVLISAPFHDGNFRWQSVDRLADAARAVYALHHAPADTLAILHPDCDHDFPTPTREQAYAFLEKPWCA